jgi:hypothetical protein
VAALTEERAALEARVEAAERASLAARAVPVAPAPAPAPATAEAPAPAPPPAAGSGASEATDARSSGPRFSFAGSEPALAAVDWKEVGTSLRSMLPLMERFVEGVRAGKAITDIPEIGLIQKHNGALVLAALELKNKKVPGRDVNGAFTHPYVQANAIAATLEAAGMPLSESQAAAIERLGREQGEAEERRRAGYDERTLALRQILEEADAREAFFTAAFAVLTQAQRDLLKPPGTKDLLHGDLFSSGLVWAQYARPLAGADRATVVQRMQQTVIATFGVPEARQPDARALVESWAPATIPATPTGFATSLHQVREAAVRQVELESRLLDLGLGADVEKKVIEYAFVHVPSGPGE